jgi:hypothetical protein
LEQHLFIHFLQNPPEAFTASNVAIFPYDFSAAASPVTKTLKIDGTTSGSHCKLTYKKV